MDAHADFFPSYRDLVKYKAYRGMASAEARGDVLKRASVEGVSGLIPYTGRTVDFIDDLELNMKAALSYAGVTEWSKFRNRVKKIRISNSSWNESLTHVV
jgi:IMP dehydrogenase/GMP reductase